MDRKESGDKVACPGCRVSKTTQHLRLDHKATTGLHLSVSRGMTKAMQVGISQSVSFAPGCLGIGVGDVPRVKTVCNTLGRA